MNFLSMGVKRWVSFLPSSIAMLKFLLLFLIFFFFFSWTYFVISIGNLLMWYDSRIWLRFRILRPLKFELPYHDNAKFLYFNSFSVMCIISLDSDSMGFLNKSYALFPVNDLIENPLSSTFLKTLVFVSCIRSCWHFNSLHGSCSDLD